MFEFRALPDGAFSIKDSIKKSIDLEPLELDPQMSEFRLLSGFARWCISMKDSINESIDLEPLEL